jgi:hypothetical protein
MIWTFIDPDYVDKNIFGFRHKIIACKVARWHGKSDIRGFHLNGWQTFAELLDVEPRNGNMLKESVWFIYAAKGV